MKCIAGIVCAAIVSAFLSHYVLNLPTLTFIASSLALVGLSKVLGDATENLSHHLGQNIAGFLNVTLSNIAEIIIIFVAVKANELELVTGGIVGSIIGNLLLVMGCSILAGCLKNGTLKFEKHTAKIFIRQFFLVTVALLLPTMFRDHIPESRHSLFSNILAIMLSGSYIYLYLHSLKSSSFKKINEQEQKLEHSWGKGFAVFVLALSGAGAFFMSELLVSEVEHVAGSLGLSKLFIGFIILPFLSNIAEHFIAIIAAWKNMTELSLAISVGSASQVGMVVAPTAVFFGMLTGNTFNLDFSSLPLGLLGISFLGSYLVLSDNEWEFSEGVLLILLYIIIAIAFGFSQ